MLTRRALIASTAALAAGCSSLESSFSVPGQPREIELTWISEYFGGFREWGLGPNDLQETLKQIVAALDEDTENPNGPAKARYTLTSRFVRSENVDPPLRSLDDLIAWYGSLEADLLSVPPFLAQLLGERGVILPLDQLVSADGSEFTTPYTPTCLITFGLMAGSLLCR